MTGDVVDVVVLGDPARTHGCLRDYAVAPAGTQRQFDNDADAWTVTTGDGTTLTARVVIDTTPAVGPSADDAVAAHGYPNYFRIPGPHTERQARYVAACLDAFRRGGSTRIEARSRIRVHPLLPTRKLTRFYLTGSVAVDDETYDGPAVLAHDGNEYPTRVRLTGHFDPIDGQYHWQGMFYADLPGERVTGSGVEIRIGEHSAQGRVAERTPWGTLTVVGVAGYPPFPLEDVEISLPPRV